MRCGICKKEGAHTVTFTDREPMALCDECASLNSSSLNKISKEWKHDRYVDALVILLGCAIAIGFIAAILMR